MPANPCVKDESIKGALIVVEAVESNPPVICISDVVADFPALGWVKGSEIPPPPPEPDPHATPVLVILFETVERQPSERP